MTDTDVRQAHYRRLAELGAEPFKVLQAWLTPEEFRGYMKGSAIVYLARERLKNRDDDVQKATHHLLRLLEAIDSSEPAPPFPEVAGLTD